MRLFPLNRNRVVALRRASRAQRALSLLSLAHVLTCVSYGGLPAYQVQPAIGTFFTADRLMFFESAY